MCRAPLSSSDPAFSKRITQNITQNLPKSVQNLHFQAAESFVQTSPSLQCKQPSEHVALTVSPSKSASIREPARILERLNSPCLPREEGFPLVALPHPEMSPSLSLVSLLCPGAMWDKSHAPVIVAIFSSSRLQEPASSRNKGGTAA